MTTKTINIAGKEVTLAYCYATEIAFARYTGVSIDKFDASNPEHILYLIISATISWSESQGKEPAIKDEDLMYKTKPKELVTAVGEILKLRSEWYEIPISEPEEEEEKEDPKNV